MVSGTASFGRLLAALGALIAEFPAKHVRRFRLIVPALTILFPIACEPAAARNLALMVAVTHYDEKAIRSLEGPNNDIVLTWREFRRRGFLPADMTVLADNLPARNDVPRASGTPTRAAILDGLKALAAKAQAGDLVVFQFSGHGSTQPVTDPAAQIEPEPDGRDQVLLPRDASFYDAKSKSIRNAIVDDELALALDAIRLKGATVWAVIDACHAGTVTRSIGDSVTRAVRASSLGVPAETRSNECGARRREAYRNVLRPRLRREGAADRLLRGRFALRGDRAAVPRLCARPCRQAERRAHRRVHGASRARAGAGKAATFRDLARLVSADMARLQGSASAPLPVFDGDLDRPIGGGEAVAAVRHAGNVDDKGVAIAAGSLHGFDVGAGVALYDGPARDAKRLAKARITEGTPATSLAATEPGSEIRFGTDVWVEVEEPVVSFTFRVARPQIPDGIDGARIAQLIDKAKDGAGRRALAIELVAPGEPADLQLAIAQGRLWALPDGQPLITDAERPGTSISLDLASGDGALAGALRRILWSSARASNLVRIASAGGTEGEAESPVAVEVDITREADPSRLADGKRACAALSQAERGREAHPGRADRGRPLRHVRHQPEEHRRQGHGRRRVLSRTRAPASKWWTTAWRTTAASSPFRPR